MPAFIRGLAQRIKLKRNGEQLPNSSLTPTELYQAEAMWIQEAQQDLQKRLANNNNNITVECRNLQVGDVVTVADQNAFQGRCIMGKILDVFPGSDGRIHNVKVKMPKGV